MEAQYALQLNQLDAFTCLLLRQVQRKKGGSRFAKCETMVSNFQVSSALFASLPVSSFLELVNLLYHLPKI